MSFKLKIYSGLSDFLLKLQCQDDDSTSCSYDISETEYFEEDKEDVSQGSDQEWIPLMQLFKELQGSNVPVLPVPPVVSHLPNVPILSVAATARTASSDVYDQTKNGKGTIFLNNILTGEEKAYKNLRQACSHFPGGPSEANIKKNYLNKPKQAFGYHIREFGHDYWRPPDNFVFNTTSLPSSLEGEGLVKAINQENNTFHLFENCRIAASFYGLVSRQLNDAVKKKMKYSGYLFGRTNDVGTYSTTNPGPNTNIFPYSIQKDDMKVVTYNLITRTSFEYVSKEKCGKALGIGKDGYFNFFKKFLNKPRQCKGYSLHSPGKPRWIPNANFVFDPKTYYPTVPDYLESRNPTTGEVKVYEGIVGFVDKNPEDGTRDGISKSLKSNKIYKSRFWRNIEDNSHVVGHFEEEE